MQERFHILFGKKRTTISVDSILSEMMAIKLGAIPNSEEAHRLLREWLQEKLPEKLGVSKGRKDASQWARRHLIEEISDKSLSKKWVDWRIDE